jgi:hypothetical protein
MESCQLCSDRFYDAPAHDHGFRVAVNGVRVTTGGFAPDGRRPPPMSERNAPPAECGRNDLALDGAGWVGRC